MTIKRPPQVGDRVFDLPSRRITTIIQIDDQRNLYSPNAIFYKMDRHVPLDATRDGAFPTRWRNAFEFCDPADAETKLLTWTY